MNQTPKLHLADPDWSVDTELDLAPATSAEHLCSSCDAVCCRLTVVLMPGDDVPEWMIATDMRGPATMAKAADGWCVAMDRDSKCCSIYLERPEICRKFAMGGPYCLDERDAWAKGERRKIPAPTGR